MFEKIKKAITADTEATNRRVEDIVNERQKTALDMEQAVEKSNAAADRLANIDDELAALDQVKTNEFNNTQAESAATIYELQAEIVEFEARTAEAAKGAEAAHERKRLAEAEIEELKQQLSDKN